MDESTIISSMHVAGAVITLIGAGSLGLAFWYLYGSQSRKRERNRELLNGRIKFNPKTMETGSGCTVFYPAHPDVQSHQPVSTIDTNTGIFAISLVPRINGDIVPDGEDK